MTEPPITSNQAPATPMSPPENEHLSVPEAVGESQPPTP